MCGCAALGRKKGTSRGWKTVQGWLRENPINDRGDESSFVVADQGLEINLGHFKEYSSYTEWALQLS